MYHNVLMIVLDFQIKPEQRIEINHVDPVNLTQIILSLLSSANHFKCMQLGWLVFLLYSLGAVVLNPLSSPV